MKSVFFAVSLAIGAQAALATPVAYKIDPNHTYPSFEADHMGGMSVWRGKFRSSSGTVTLDSEAHTGDVDITIDTASIDFGLDRMEAHARSPELFDVEKYPTATFKGKLTKFENGAPTEVAGDFTLHGVTRPLTLTIRSFKCQVNPMSKKQTCGADAAASFNRDDYGIDYGKAFGFNMAVKLAIQVEAAKAD